MLTPILYAEESAMPIVVNGDKVQYDHANKRVIGTGNVSITYQDIKMTCEKIIVDLENKEGVAEGEVTLYQDDDVFTAETVVYNFEDKTGQLMEGTMKMLPWYGKAESIDKINEELFKLNRSYITTCDFEQPHYRVEAKTIKVYLGDRVTAWHALCYIGDLPVLYIPYYNHPLEDDMPQVNMVPGHNDDWGFYLLTAWRFYFHPDSRGYVHLDYRTERGFAEGIDYKYGLRKFGNGYFRFYHIHDRNPDISDMGSKNPSERYRVQLRHKWNVDKNTFVEGEFHKLSDKDFLKDFFYKEEYELEEQPSTYITLSGAKGNYSLSFLYRKKIDDFFTVTEKLPEAKLYIRKQKLFNHLNLYYRNESSAVRFNKSFTKAVGWSTPEDRYNTNRLDSYNELSYPFNFLNFLNINPFAGIRETFYSKDARSHNNVTRSLFRTGASFYTKFYKIFDFETDFLGLDIHDVRHLIMPSAYYAYDAKPDIKPAELYQFDAIDEICFKNAVNLALETKLQTKRAGKNGIKKSVDLLRFTVGGEYIFKDSLKNENKLMDIDFDLEVRPYDWMLIESKALYNRERKTFDTFSLDLHSNRTGNLWMSGGYRYEKQESSQLTGELAFHINKDNWRKHWKFRIYERYEFRERRFQEQEYSITKDLHCWTGELTCRVKDESDYTFWLIFKLKAFPNIPFFFRTTYHGPEPGARM